MKTGAALTLVQYRFASKVKYSCWYLHGSADSILLRLTAHPVPFDQMVPLNVLKTELGSCCYPKGMQNPWRSPSYCWPVNGSPARVEMACSLHCVSCWKPELAETAALLLDGQERWQFPTAASSLWNGYSPTGESGSGPESGNAQCWLWWKSEIGVPICMWGKRSREEWAVYLLSAWWVADLTYATSSLSNID